MKLLVARTETYADLLTAHIDASNAATAEHKQELAAVRSEIEALKTEIARLRQLPVTIRQQTHETLAEIRREIAAGMRDLVRGRTLAIVLCVLLLFAALFGAILSLRRQSQDLGRLEQDLTEVQLGLEQSARQQAAIVQFLNADAQRRRP